MPHHFKNERYLTFYIGIFSHSEDNTFPTPAFL